MFYKHKHRLMQNRVASTKASAESPGASFGEEAPPRSLVHMALARVSLSYRLHSGGVQTVFHLAPDRGPRMTMAIDADDLAFAPHQHDRALRARGPTRLAIRWGHIAPSRANSR